MRIFAIVGQSFFTVDETDNPSIPDGHIEMQYQRPEPDYVAMEDGTWGPRVLSEEEQRLLRIEEINNELIALDQQAIRPVAAITNATISETEIDQYDADKLAQIVEQKQILRQELSELLKPVPVKKPKSK